MKEILFLTVMAIRIEKLILLTAFPLMLSTGAAQAASLDFSGATVSGQLGTPGGLRFGNVLNDASLGSLDLVVVNTSDYTAANLKNNTVSGEFGQINLLTGTNTDFQFRLVKTGTDMVVTPKTLVMTFLDLDGSTNQGPFESISVFTPSTYRAGSAVNVTEENGQATFSGTFAAGGKNNPTGLNLNQEQSSIAVELEFANRGIFDFNFDSGAGSSGRNILFAGEVTFAAGEPPQSGSISKVPEPNAVLGLLAFGSIAGVSSTLKAQKKKS